MSLMEDTSHPPSLRLRVLETSILHRRQSLAVLDGYAEAQFGRDVAPTGSETPRIRLKEMAVSKLHATVFWDETRCEWAVVDMGSKHGTFLHSARHPDAEPARLSPPRTASVPRPLLHLDRLIVGSTTFQCHIHDDRMPCLDCTPTDQDIIPLFAVPKHTAEKRPPDAPHEARDAKKALTSLRRTLLARLDPDPLPPTHSYTDRSARRRAMHPGSQLDSPGVQSSRNSSPVPETVATPEPSVGWRLLMKQGWQPGTALGDGGGRVEPIEVFATTHRAGIGMPHGPLSTRASGSRM